MTIHGRAPPDAIDLIAIRERLCAQGLGETVSMSPSRSVTKQRT